MLSRALRLATVILLVGCGSATLAKAQNLEAGKSPSQLFSATCAVCHKSSRGLLKTVAPGSLPGFLREHYTTSRDMAAMLSSYLLSNGATDPRAGGGLTKRGRELSKELSSEQKPGDDPAAAETPSRRRPRPGQPQEAVQPDADGRIPGESRPGRAARRDPAVTGEPVTATEGEPEPKQKSGKRHRRGREEPPKPKPEPVRDDPRTATPVTPMPGEGATPETPKPEPAKPDPDGDSKLEAAKPEAAKSEAEKSEAAKPDAPKADAPKPDAPKPEAAQSEVDRSGAPKAPEESKSAPVLRPDPVPPVTPAPPASAPPAVIAPAEPAAAPVQSPPSAPAPPPPVVVAPPQPPAGPPAPPISQ